MGKSYSCYQCFSKEYQSSTCESLSLLPDLNTTSSQTIHFPDQNDYQTYDNNEIIESETISKTELIDTISKANKRFLEEISQNPETLGYTKAQSQGPIEVYLKDLQGGYSLMSIWKCDIEAAKVAKFLKLVEKRKDWDTNVAECKKICDITENIAVYYTLYKRFLMMAPRDTLIVGQQLSSDKGYIDVSTSINSSIVPETNSIVRAQISLAGYSIQPITKDDSGNITQIISVSEANFGQSLAISMVKNMSISLTPKFVRTMIDGMKKFDSLLN